MRAGIFHNTVEAAKCPLFRIVDLFAAAFSGGRGCQALGDIQYHWRSVGEILPTGDAADGCGCSRLCRCDVV